jgi:TNF receptor-associated protein 1
MHFVGIVKKYSNFVGFPIKLNDKTVNTVQPLWTMEKTAVTDEQHKEFYRYISSAWDSYQYRLHFRADAPIQVSTLLYIPERHNEYMGMGRMEPGVSLYSRRVLIQPKSKSLLPDYLRFVKGTPLNLF